MQTEVCASLPHPRTRNPLILPDGSCDPATVFLSEVIDHPNIEVGDWTYYNDRTLPDDYAATVAPYLFPGAPERLTIGRFCQIAQGAASPSAGKADRIVGFQTRRGRFDNPLHLP